MRAVPGIYDEGKVHFTYTLPDYVGPIRVLVIFPGDDPEPEEAFLDFLDKPPWLEVKKELELEEALEPC